MALNNRVIVVDLKPKLVSLLDKLSDVRAPAKPNGPPSLYFDIEGRNLGRYGSMSILTLHLASDDTTYLIDVLTLQSSTFTTTNAKGTCLKGVLESATIPKGFFDIRNDSDALSSLFGVRVDGVHDIQLMELARRRASRRCLAGLARCIETDLARSKPEDRRAAAGAARAKRAGERLWNPRLGGSLAAFDARPMPPAIVDYCRADVAVLPSLWRAYMRELSGGSGQRVWRARIRKATADRISDSQKPSYNPQGENRFLGPSGW